MEHDPAARHPIATHSPSPGLAEAVRKCVGRRQEHEHGGARDGDHDGARPPQALLVQGCRQRRDEGSGEGEGHGDPGQVLDQECLCVEERDEPDAPGTGDVVAARAVTPREPGDDAESDRSGQRADRQPHGLIVHERPRRRAPADGAGGGRDPETPPREPQARLPQRLGEHGEHGCRDGEGDRAPGRILDHEPFAAEECDDAERPHDRRQVTVARDPEHARRESHEDRRRREEAPADPGGASRTSPGGESSAIPAAAEASATTPAIPGTTGLPGFGKRSWKTKPPASTPAAAAISAQPPYERSTASTANSGTSKSTATASTPAEPGERPGHELDRAAPGGGSGDNDTDDSCDDRRRQVPGAERDRDQRERGGVRADRGGAERPAIRAGGRGALASSVRTTASQASRPVSVRGSGLGGSQQAGGERCERQGGDGDGGHAGDRIVEDHVRPGVDGEDVNTGERAVDERGRLQACVMEPPRERARGARTRQPRSRPGSSRTAGRRTRRWRASAPRRRARGPRAGCRRRRTAQASGPGDRGGGERDPRSWPAS